MGLSDSEKIRVMLPHWLEHNKNHITEFSEWQGTAAKEGMAEIADLIGQAVSKMGEIDELLTEALAKAGGALEDHGHHHHHH